MGDSGVRGMPFPEVEIGKRRLVTVRFAPKTDIRQRIEHVCFAPTTELTAKVDCPLERCVELSFG